jgi:glycerate dehydrogenase
MERIIVTDGYTLNPGDLNWDVLNTFGDVTVHERSDDQSLVIERCKSATIIVTNKTPISAEVMDAVSQLKLVIVTATGYNIVDTAHANKRNIVVSNVPGYGTDSVAQHTFALLLELVSHVGKNAKSVSEGEWSNSKDFCYSKAPIIEISSKTLGIIGYGKIGQKVAAIARAFGMKVMYHNSSTRPGKEESVSVEQVFRESDFVSLHCPLTNENRGFVNRDLISIMKPSAYLVNTARGQLINENDLAQALENKTLAGAALDVLSKEPPDGNNPLIGINNCIITPHTAWLSYEARQRIMMTTIDNISNFLAGRPKNIVGQL